MCTLSFGVKDIRLPFKVKQRESGIQHSVATISCEVVAPSKDNNFFISVLSEALSDFTGRFSINDFNSLLNQVKRGLSAESTKLQIDFPFFIEKSAPVSGTKSLMEYDCTFIGELSTNSSFYLAVQVPVTTLCPCSKEISYEGAHNQRAEVTFRIKYTTFIWIEELIELIEKSASCEVYALLKRPDEKYVTEKAYNNPMFVEDVVRKVAQNAFIHPAITWFSAGAESFESIHKHSAYAYVDSDEID